VTYLCEYLNHFLCIKIRTLTITIDEISQEFDVAFTKNTFNTIDMINVQKEVGDVVYVVPGY
jgi:hypothetical protein